MNTPSTRFFKQSVWLAVISLIGFASLSPALARTTGATLLESYRTKVEPILSRYCYDCHGLGISKGGVTLDEFTAANISDETLWLRILKNTRAHIMPPSEEALPTDHERTLLLNWVKAGPFAIDPHNPDPGKIPVHRLNRTEYKNTIFDLTGVVFDSINEFPQDNSGEGFDNIGGLLTLSPMMMEKYIDAASQIISEAVPTYARIRAEHHLAGEKLVKLFSPTTIPDDESPESLQLSFYEPSIRSANYPVKQAGHYEINLQIRPFSYVNFQGFDYNKCRFILKIDGHTKIDQEFENLSGKVLNYTFALDWSAGDHPISFEVQPTTSGMEQIKRLKMRIDQITVLGPSAPEHWVKPNNYDRFFPGGIPAEATARRTYTEKLLRDFATRAFRRPVDQETVDQYTQLATSITTQKGYNYEMGIAQAMTAILASPRFLFREERTLPVSGDGKHPLIDEYALASRLSYFFWSTMPDQELSQLAAQGKLRTNLDQQVKRMVAHPRSDQFIKNFAGQWLHTRDIEAVNISSLDIWLRDHPNPEILSGKNEYQRVREIPAAKRTAEEQAVFDHYRALSRSLEKIDRPQLKAKELRAMRQETELYFEHVIRGNRNLLELLVSNYTFLNDTLTKHYGIDGVVGSKMRKVTLPPGSPRGGILTQGALLTVTSNPTRTSPVKRGVFILENILGTPPAAPPPNIPSLEDAAHEKGKILTLRESLAIHRENELCRSCHNRMDPLGLAMENFNAMGIWRDAELSQPIDVAGQLVTGERFHTIQGLKHILATERKNDFYYCFSEKTLTYALGRGIEYYDTATVDHLVDTLQKTGGQAHALFHAIVNSTPFQKARAPNHQPQ